MMRKLANLFQKKQKQEKLPEDIFFSPRCVYYESDMEGINSGQYQVFTLYPSLYMEESNDDFWILCNGIFHGLLQNRNVLITVKIIDGSPETKNAAFQRLKEWKTRNQEAVILESDEGYQILCRADNENKLEIQFHSGIVMVQRMDFEEGFFSEVLENEKSSILTFLHIQIFHIYNKKIV